ncbi:metallophosphoesterase [Sphingomonas xanthus]|uniref:Serine/threonine protein phosphatase n=1 Tax=Sphingomonas xanthus TaxID=2594473 RepID=A0A516IU71_9SPHN|nr:metallophosphoesterase [Sphingomonas xanthus]QDP20422.1 serine/threonine protein phosphatase [Sphingomonas xanthus]
MPEGLRVYAIGDVHGSLRHLEALLSAIAEDLRRRPATAHLVFLGDLVDRGPATAGVIERVMADLPGDAASFLCGNHEEVMLACYDGEPDSCEKWLQYGGLQTLESYGITRSEIFSRAADIPALMRECIPRHHIEFLRGFDNYVVLGDYAFVHAGIRPGRAIEDQDVADLRWIRSGFLDDQTNHGFTIVHGHTIVPKIEVRSNRIAVDTGCYQSGILSALVLEGIKKGTLIVRRGP